VTEAKVIGGHPGTIKLFRSMVSQLVDDINGIRAVGSQ
jgi:hypothetical protein